MVARNYQDTFHRERNELMRLHSEELSKQRTRVAIAYEYDSEQADKLRCALDQMKATVARKGEQIKQLQREHDEQVK